MAIAAARKPGLPKLTKQNMEGAPEERYIDSIKSTMNVTVQEIEKLRSDTKGIKLADSANVEVAEFDVQAPDPWISVADASLSSGWVAAAGAPGFKYMKAPGGQVEARINLQGGVDGVVFTLPVGYRPSDPTQDAGLNLGTFAGVLISITAAGVVSVTGSGGALWVGHVVFLSSDAVPVPLSCWPKFIKTKFKAVSGVSIMNVSDAQDTAKLPAGAVYQPVWEFSTQAGIPQVKLLNIAGLPYNRKSRVRLLIFGA